VKIVLFGYGEMGRAGLEFLLERGEDVAAVVTHRDDPGEKRWFRSLAERAEGAGLSPRYGEELGPPGLEALMRELKPDFLLSFYYRSMISTRALAHATRGALNLHGSLLPRLRGRAPLNWALVEGETRTGVTLHHMVREPDAGDIVAQRGWDIGPEDTAKTLFDRAVAEAKILLADVWPRLVEGRAPRVPQDPAQATYRGRRRPEDGRIDWSAPTRRIDGLVRAVTDPFPGAFTFVGGRKLMVWKGAPAVGRGAPGTVLDGSTVATGDGAYRIDRMDPADVVFAPGTVLGG
jgi:methionyl-tRNA formyltransferase